ncbi:MAG: hybrid sensor histidine kinase/response regulator [Deltaproteobacteria bacterium]|nr:hybrid sensor histidine kinase/response regulator [Deltaproteobacteria bacterium]
MDIAELEKKLMEAFRTESAERLESLFTNLTELENAENEDDRQKILEIVFREAHSLKGAARSVNIGPVEHLCHSMEDLLGAIRNKSLDFSPQLFDLLNQSTAMVEKFLSVNDAAHPAISEKMAKLASLLESIRDGEKPGTAVSGPEPVSSKEEAKIPIDTKPEEKQEHEPVCVEAEPLPDTHPVSEHKKDKYKKAEICGPTGAKPLFAGSVRVPAAKLDSLLLKAEELISLKQITGRYLFSAMELLESFDLPRRLSDIKNDYEAIREISDRTGRYARIIDYIDHMGKLRENGVSYLADIIRAMEQGNRTLSSMIDDIIDATKAITLLPFSTLFAIFPRMVREISRDLGKSAQLKISGGEIEIDKRILEGIKDPMIHLLRNAVDHGIENPEIRKQRKKRATGTITINVAQTETNRVELTIEEDGGGIDTKRLIAKAVKAGIIDPKDADLIPLPEALALIFHSGISTSALITEISGRGLGMAIVKENIENLGGKISIENFPDHGTRFVIRLPVTKATFRGILIRTAGRSFIMPNANVDRILRIRRDAIETIENRPVTRVNDQALAIGYLHSILGLPVPNIHETHAGPQALLTVVVVEHDDRRIALVVDEIIHEMEVLVKNLGRQIERIPYVAGATVLGSGEVVPVLNTGDIINAAASGPSTLRVPEEAMEEQEEKSVIVVEDSFTARTLLKNILEASGYEVKTAVNGEEGYALLKSRHFDAVVSDIEMPKMNGFELTKRIRADETLADKPVILVTTLDSREDRERGMEAGADAYIVKSSFDQSNLLDILGRLA